MCERPTIHVFLGAPPPPPAPPSDPTSVTETVGGIEDGPPAGWRRLELTWTDGRLRLVTGAAGSSRDDTDTDDSTRRSRVHTDPTNPGQDHASAAADWTTETPPEPEQTHCDINWEQVELCSNHQEPDQADPCSAALHGYLDHCFPAAQPGPQQPGSQQPGPQQPGSQQPGPQQPGSQQPGPQQPGSQQPGPQQPGSQQPGSQQPGPQQPGPQQPGPQQPGSQQPEPLHQASPRLCTTTQFLSTWTLSQALILRGSQSAGSPGKTPPPQTPTKHTRTSPSASSSTPELFSPMSPSPGSSAELFSQICSPQRRGEGGVVLQVTSDGVLCSQEAAASTPAHESPVKSPEFKKVRISEEPATEAPSRVRAPTTTLVQCRVAGARYSVLVAVVYPCHLKEVKVKSGPSAGTFVPLASIVVTDQSAVEMKVVLWRRAAFWVLTVNPGDVLLITGLQVNEDRWRGETLLQTTFSTKLLNLGPITTSTSPTALQHVDALSLSSLCGYLRERRPLLVSLPHHAPQDLNRLPYATLRSLRVNMLVHALLRVTHTHISSEWRSEAESRCRSALQLKAVLTVEQPDGHQGTLVLWRAAVDWLPRFNRDRAAVWDFRVLLVRDGLTSDLPELHSTPWSSVRPLHATDRRVRDFLAPRQNQTGSGGGCSVELDVETLLSQRYSGEAELSVHVTSFHFQDVPSSQNAPQQLLDGSTQMDSVLETLSGDVTYTGCGRCCAELATDTNGIYGPCYPCLPHTAVRRYYRQGVLTVSGRGHSQMCVQVPPLPLEKILEAPPDKLHRSSAPGSEVKYIQVAAERLLSLVALPKKSVIISVRSHFLCDENSALISQDFTLLDLHFPS